ncbi:Putative metal-dependent hydrolase YfiT [Phycisphaerae bacterium RAS2]|nr:Putative metal-dependent hydrolase YfiT [Phycisphaerae bacterium RAS2]
MPHFYESIPEAVRSMTDQQAVEAYAQGAEMPARAIVGLTDSQLDALPIPGTWSIRQIVVHLMDSDLIAAYRMKRIIAEDRPRLDVWDENAFVPKLRYERQSASRAAELFRVNRLVMADILRGLPVDAFARVALHPEVGELPLGVLLRLYVHHVHHHLAFIEKKRNLVGAGSIT